MTRILLYSAEPVLVKGLEALLAQDGGFDLLLACGSIASLTEQMVSRQPDVVLMDMTSEVTLQVLNELRLHMIRSKIVLWVNSISTELAFQAMALGIRGILRKTLPAALQVKCLQKVQDGELWFEKTLTDSFMYTRRVSLTKREGQIATLLAQGLKNKEIGAALTVTEGTIKVYLSRLYEKVGVKDRFELAIFALKNLCSLQTAGEGKRREVDLTLGLRSLVLDDRPAIQSTASELPSRNQRSPLRVA